MVLDKIDTLFDDTAMAEVVARSSQPDQPAPGMTFGEVITLHAEMPRSHMPVQGDPFAAGDFLDELD